MRGLLCQLVLIDMQLILRKVRRTFGWEMRRGEVYLIGHAIKFVWIEKPGRGKNRVFLIGPQCHAIEFV